MTYENMYEVIKYMQTNNIKITKEILDILKRVKRLPSNNMAILGLPMEYIKIFFQKQNPELLEFLMEAYKKNYNFAKVTNYSSLLMSPNMEYRGLILKALLNENIFNSDFAMNIIIKQIYIHKLDALIKACEIPEIRNNFHLLEIISGAMQAEDMLALTEAFKHEEIRNDEVAVEYLTKQQYTQCITTITKALLNPNIKNNPQVLDLIARTENPYFQSVLYEACLNPKILEDYEFLTFLTEMPSRNEKAKIFIEAYSKLNKKEYKEFMDFYKINKSCHTDTLKYKLNSLIDRRSFAFYQEKLDTSLNANDIEKFMNEYQEIAENPVLRRVKHLNIPTE